MPPTAAPTGCFGDSSECGGDMIKDEVIHPSWLILMWFSIFAAYNCVVQLVVWCSGKRTGHDPPGCRPWLSNRRKLGLAAGVTLLAAGNLVLYFTALSGRSDGDRDLALVDFNSIAIAAVVCWFVARQVLGAVYSVLLLRACDAGGCRARFVAVDALLFSRKELAENERWGMKHPLTVTTPGGTVLVISSWAGSWNLNRAVLGAWGKADPGAKAWRPEEIELYSEGYGEVVDAGYSGESRLKLLDRPTDDNQAVPRPRARELMLRFGAEVIMRRTPTEAAEFGLAHPLSVTTLDGSSFDVAGWGAADDLYAAVAAAAPAELGAKLGSFYLVAGDSTDALERGFATQSRAQLLGGSTTGTVDTGAVEVPPPPPPLVLLYHPEVLANQQVSVV